VKSITAEARERYIGRTLRVLITEKEKDFKGRAINYHQVIVKGFKGKLGDFVNVKIIDANHGSLFGEPVK
jgi:tRNA A37 methylthiotransferase MiaB